MEQQFHPEHKGHPKITRIRASEEANWFYPFAADASLAQRPLEEVHEMVAQRGKEAELAEAQGLPLVLGRVAAGIARYFPVEDSEKLCAGRLPRE